MRSSRISILIFVILVVVGCASKSEINKPESKYAVYFIEPRQNETVSSPVRIVMATKGVTVTPAGKFEAGKGHHHLIVNNGFVPKGEIVPADAKHIHFGKGQTETELKLPRGKHTLTLQFADGYHRSYGPELSSTIIIYVK